MPVTPTLDKTILSFPTLLSLAVKDEKSRRSWIQLARTGSFVSNRYGKFAITKEDLSQMLHNFKHVTPKAPTELPIDYDHLSMDPKNPGDGVAAGWMKKLELRENGEELWAQVEWTPRGAQHIESGEYRFVSPSFVKDHTHKDGKKIGTTLLAAAITNHPFLENMQALTLFNFASAGDVALNWDEGKHPRADNGKFGEGAGGGTSSKTSTDEKKSGLFGKVKGFLKKVDDKINTPIGGGKKPAPGDTPASVVKPKGGGPAIWNPKSHPSPVVRRAFKKMSDGESLTDVELFDLAGACGISADPILLSDIGQRVMIAPGNARTQDEIGGTFEIVEVIGEGDDSFVSIRDANGVIHKWFRGTELLPASSTPALPATPNLQPGQGPPGVPVPPGQPGAPPVAAMPPAAPVAAPGVPGMPVQPAPGVPGAPVMPTPAVAAAPAAAAPAAPAAAAPFGSAAPEPAPNQVVAPAMPVAAPPAAQNDSGKNAKEGTPNPFVAKKDAKAAEGAVGSQAQNQPPGQPSAQPVVQKPEKSENVGQGSADKRGNDPMAFLKSVAGALATQKGIANMMFKLRNDQNEEIEVSLDQLEAAGIKVVPDGATAVPNSELSDMKGKIVTLSSTVDVLKTENEARAKEAHHLALTTELDRLMKGAFITKVTRDTLYEQFKSATDLSMFKAITASFTKPIVALNVEHGSGGDADSKSPGEQATERIIALRDTLMKEKGMSLRDATIEAGSRLADEAEAYQDSYRPVA